MTTPWLADVAILPMKPYLTFLAYDGSFGAYFFRYSRISSSLFSRQLVFLDLERRTFTLEPSMPLRHFRTSPPVTRFGAGLFVSQWPPRLVVFDAH